MLDMLMNFLLRHAMWLDSIFNKFDVNFLSNVDYAYFPYSNQSTSDHWLTDFLLLRCQIN